MNCWGGSDPNTGCPFPDTCMDHGFEVTTANGTTGYCWNFCPVTCHGEEMLCPGFVDFSTGCQWESDYCIPSINYGYGWNDDGPVDCPAFCWPQCDWNVGAYYCSGGFDDNGCELPGWCSVDVNEANCPHGFYKK